MSKSFELTPDSANGINSTKRWQQIAPRSTHTGQP